MNLQQSITYKGIDLTVTVYYTPEERSTYDYPGCDADIDIQEILYKDVDVWEIYDSLNALDEIEDSFSEQYEWGNEYDGD